MLLRRIFEHVRSQNWTSVTLDLVIVVLGIFLGLQASQWYEHRQETALGDSILQRLSEEFLTISSEAAAAFEFHQEQASALSIVRQAVAAAIVAKDEQEHFARGLVEAMSYDLGPSRSGTYIEILSSGQFRLIQDTELRSALSAYDDKIQKADALFSIFQQNQRKHEAVFNRHFSRRTAQKHHFEGSPTGLMITHGELAAYDLEAMASDEEFLVALERLIEYHINYQFWHGSIVRSVNRVRTLLEELSA